MTSAMIKNFPVATAVELKDEVVYASGQVVSKTLAQNAAVSVTLFAFDKNEEISTHSSHGDALVLCLDGMGLIRIEDQEFTLSAGQSILMPAEKEHSVFASERFKMLLVVVFPKN